MTDGIEFDRGDRVATIRLNRPARRNAFTLAMIAQWRRYLREAQDDDGVSVIILTGAGDSFCSGIDLAELKAVREGDDELDAILTEHIHGVARAMEAVTKPIIAAVRGPAVGAGMDMSLMCDLRIADATATFCERYIDVGILPGDGGGWLLPRIVGMSRALRLLWTAETLSAADAHRVGIVDVLVADGELGDAVADITGQLASKPRVLLQAMKTVVRAGVRQDFLSSLNFVAQEQRKLRRDLGG
jgi:enoyl-CoA hydratase/carnithine racemase